MLKSKGLPTAAWVYYIDHPVEHTQDLVMQLTADEIRANKVFRAVEKEGVQILELVSRNKRVAVKSGHSIGKTKTVCDLILWYMNTRVMATVVLTGAKFDQLKITTWAELGKWYECSTLRGDFEYTSERFFRKSHPKTWFTQIVTSLSPENIAGVHGEHVLVIVDEASAESVDRVRDPLLSLISRADNKLVLFGNPTRTEGMFFDAFHRDRDLWKTMTVNSEDSRIACSDPDFIASYKRRYHVDSDIYRVRIRGEFAKGNPKAVIALSDCESARNRVVVGGDFLEMAVDPAYEGNDLAGIGIRQGNKVLEIRVYPKCTPQELYRYVLKMVRDYRAKVKISSRIKIKVDMGGGFGSPLLESISLNREDNIEGVPINFGGKYDGEYRNYGTYMWFNLGTMIGQVQLPDDDDLIEELSSREWEPANMDKITIESKGKCKDRLGRSPDRADTCVMLFAGGGKKVFDIEIEQPSMVKEFEIDWRLKNLRNSDFSGVFPIESFNYAAIVINENLTLNGIVGIYQFIQNKLWVYEEFFQETPIAEYLALHVKRIILTNRVRDMRVFGNKAMFTSKDGALSFAAVARRNQLHLIEQQHYDYYGAIALGAQMFTSGDIAIHNRCVRAQQQIGQWAIKNNKPEENMGYCEALLIILSEIRQQKKMKPPEPDFYKSPYSGEYHDYKTIDETKTEKTSDYNQWMRR